MTLNFSYLMTNLIVAKFGGSAIGADGLSIPIIIQRVNELKKMRRWLQFFLHLLQFKMGKLDH